LWVGSAKYAQRQKQRSIVSRRRGSSATDAEINGMLVPGSGGNPIIRRRLWRRRKAHGKGERELMLTKNISIRNI